MLARRQIPNLLTYARFLAVPASLGIICLAPHQTQWLFWIFIAASITDFLDGYLARKWNAVSTIGALLDPVADKLLVALLLLYLLVMFGSILVLPVAVILLREIYISALREFLATKQVELPVSKGGKVKTALQMIAIALLLGQLTFNPPGQINFPCKLVQGKEGLVTSCIEQPILLRIAEMAGQPLLAAAAIVALLTALHYTYAARKSLR